MTIHNHNHSNRNYDNVPRSARHLYTAPLCVECGSYVLPYRDGSNLCHCPKCGEVPFVNVLETEVVSYRETAKTLSAMPDEAPKLPHVKMIVTKEFAERWTTNPEHYREHFDKFGGDVEVQR